MTTLSPAVLWRRQVDEGRLERLDRLRRRLGFPEQLCKRLRDRDLLLEPQPQHPAMSESPLTAVDGREVAPCLPANLFRTEQL